MGVDVGNSTDDCEEQTCRQSLDLAMPCGCWLGAAMLSMAGTIVANSAK